MLNGKGKALEFFAGVGLARLGLEEAGWEIVFANDIDARKAAMHEGHFGPDPTYVVDDVFRIESVDLPPAELAWASFPCVDLSLAGNRAGLDGSSSGAYWGFHRILANQNAERRPEIVVLENVTGLLSSNGGRDMATLIGSLDSLGYVADIVLVDAANFVPQSRPRIFVIASNTDLALASERLRTTNWLRPKSIQDFAAKFPDLGIREFANPAKPDRRRTFGDVAERFPKNADIWWKGAATDKLLSQMNERHGRAVQDLAARDSLAHLTVYKRVRSSGCMAEVRFDGLAGCLRTPKGGSSRQFVLEVGRGEVRARHMTAIEYGRLQGAPNYKIRVPEMQALFGFGDAVCVDAVAWLASNLLEPIRGRAGADRV